MTDLTPSDFLGHWSIARTIQDAKSASTAQFTGTAEIKQGVEDWIYSERGTLVLASGAQFVAERMYFWRPSGAGFDVFFDDKRFFHRFDLVAAAQAQHWCDPDKYEVAYDFSRWPCWQSTWQVSGPRKDYVMQSSYRAQD